MGVTSVTGFLDGLANHGRLVVRSLMVSVKDVVRAQVDEAARALAAGDPLGALNRVALRDDAPALALRGIAMAQLGDLVRARLWRLRLAPASAPCSARYSLAAAARCSRLIAGERVVG